MTDAIRVEALRKRFEIRDIRSPRRGRSSPTARAPSDGEPDGAQGQLRAGAEALGGQAPPPLRCRHPVSVAPTLSCSTLTLTTEPDRLRWNRPDGTPTADPRSPAVDPTQERHRRGHGSAVSPGRLPRRHREALRGPGALLRDDQVFPLPHARAARLLRDPAPRALLRQQQPEHGLHRQRAVQHAGQGAGVRAGDAAVRHPRHLHRRHLQRSVDRVVLLVPDAVRRLHGHLAGPRDARGPLRGAPAVHQQRADVGREGDVLRGAPDARARQGEHAGG